MTTEGETHGRAATLVPFDEPRRLAELQAYGILDTPNEDHFEALTRLAVQICGTPVGLLSLVDRHRVWFKSRLGLAAAELPREHTICGDVVTARRPLQIPDLLLDGRYAQLPGVAGGPCFRFYAGFPLLTGNGHALGSLCVLDLAPRVLDAAQYAAMQTLAGHAMSQLDLRRAASGLRAQRETERDAEDRLLDQRAVEMLRLRVLLDSAATACKSLSLRLPEAVLLQDGWSAALHCALRSDGGEHAGRRCQISCPADLEAHLDYADLYRLLEFARIATRAVLQVDDTAELHIAVSARGHSVLLQIESAGSAGGGIFRLDGAVHRSLTYLATRLNAQLEIRDQADAAFSLRCMVPRVPVH